ncbi:hypothetical protein [Bacillus sp. mrc49]|uniref:hypothetical protein n=1 Tax=Bacillus sp. mrc49 TaxID=2054913 RepID=UPI000C26E66E|nr:hypothetical protein [Bacillus sp. mrc49]PJN86846.1 hypothetical protein CVN76_27725 [Bacillus sp. mrc49]
MGINSSYYNSKTDYMDRVVASSGTYFCSKFTVLRGALTVGLAPKEYLSIPKEVAEWKLATVNAFIEFSTSPLTMKNITHLETSEKVNVAYFLGMVFSQIYMQTHYGLRHLEHLRNSGIKVSKRTTRKMNPDLWGISTTLITSKTPPSPKSFLVEAKGSTTRSTYFNDENVDKAARQLGVVTQINYKSSAGAKPQIFNSSLSNLEKLVVATHPNDNGEITQHIVDPTNGQDNVVEVNGDETVYKHYLGIMNLIANETIIPSTKSGIKFKVVEYKKLGCFVGISEKVFDIVYESFKGKKVTSKSLEGINNKINKELDDLNLLNNIESENLSIGIDGIIVFKD